MSWGTCYSGSNNIHAGFPALMSDGRWASNWEPGCAINNQLKKQVKAILQSRENKLLSLDAKYSTMQTILSEKQIQDESYIKRK